MSRRKKDSLRYGDFQTPDILCERVCRLVRSLKIFPKSIVESTCGAGSFFHASADKFPECERLPGFGISPDYVKMSQTVKGASVYCEDFFKKNWTATCNRLSEPILVLGNPPWVTNATMRALGGKNLPVKSDSQGLSEIDTITGKSNFDISEWMLSHLYERLSGRSATITMLCKTTVACKVLKYAWTRHLQVGESAMYLIDAPKHFGASVDACLLISILEPGSYSQECKVYRNLEAHMCQNPQLLIAGDD